MKALRVDSTDNRFKEQSFLVVRPKRTGFYSLNDRYHLIDEQNEHYGYAYLVSIKEMFVAQVDNEIAFLDKNCTADIYKQILTDTYNFKESTVINKMIFSTVNPLKNYDV